MTRSAPRERFLVEVCQSRRFGKNVFAEAHRPSGLIDAQVPVSRPGNVIVPDAAADRIKDNALKTVIVAYGPAGTSRFC